MSNLYKRRRQIFLKQGNDPERRENLLELAGAAESFQRRTEDLKAAQKVPFNESYDLGTLPPTLIPSALQERARERIQIIAARMKR